MMNNNQPPSQIWIGSPEKLEQETISYLQNLLCATHGCTTCTTCQHIKEKQHHAIMWLCPEKGYTLATLEPLVETLAFSLESGSHFFFVLQKADYLSTTCANSLLKSIEEPPAGYHFIFHSQRKSALLPTIQSRSSIKHSNSGTSSAPAPLAAFFTSPLLQDPAAFNQHLSGADLTDQTSYELLDYLITYWHEHYKQACTEKNDEQKKKSTERLTLFKQALKKGLMPGSAKIFWRNLYLAIAASSN